MNIEIENPKRVHNCTCSQLQALNIPGCCEWCEFMMFEGSHDEIYNNYEDEE